MRRGNEDIFFSMCLITYLPDSIIDNINDTFGITGPIIPLWIICNHKSLFPRKLKTYKCTSMPRDGIGIEVGLQQSSP